MRILLVGEFSGVHTTLAEVLKESGYEVTTVSDGDSYKNFPRDITITSCKRKGKVAAVLRMLLDLSGFKGLITYAKHRKLINKLTDFDVVQFINTIPLDCFGSVATFLLFRTLKKNNKKVFLCALGDDYRWVKACLGKKISPSPMDDLTARNIYKYIYSLKYVYGFLYPALHHYIEKECDAIIPGLHDYAESYKNVEHLTSIVPLPLPKLIYEDAKNHTAIINSEKVTIFHGWQLGREIKKGNYLFDAAVKRVMKTKVGENIDYKIIKSLPFNEYIYEIKNADIFLDQTYSCDRGMNGIFGMSYSSVVFSGFRNESTYNLGVNAIPDVDYLEKKIISLLENKKEMKLIKQNAREYAIERHNPYKVMNQYISIWNGRK